MTEEQLLQKIVQLYKEQEQEIAALQGLVRKLQAFVSKSLPPPDDKESWEKEKECLDAWAETLQGKGENHA